MSSAHPVVYRLLIAAPADVAAARQTILETIQDWNLANARRGIALEAARWEQVVSPGASDRSADAIVRDLAAEFDLVVGVYWTRLGAGAGARRGSLDAVAALASRQRPVVLCFSTSPVPPDVDAAQYRELLDFRASWRGPMLHFGSTSELRHRLTGHLNSAVDELKYTSRPAKDAGRDTASAARPPLREPKSSRLNR